VECRCKGWTEGWLGPVTACKLDTDIFQLPLGSWAPIVWLITYVGCFWDLSKLSWKLTFCKLKEGFFVVDDKATQIGTSVDQENTTCTATVCCKKSCHRHIIGTSNRSDLHSPPQFYINLTTKLVQTTVLKPVLHKFI
jgi:hypothetical protein